MGLNLAFGPQTNQIVKGEGSLIIHYIKVKDKYLYFNEDKQVGVIEFQLRMFKFVVFVILCAYIINLNL